MNKLTVVLCLLFISVSTVLVLAQIVFPSQFSIAPGIEKGIITFPKDDVNIHPSAFSHLGGKKLPVKPTAVATTKPTMDSDQYCNSQNGLVYYKGNCSGILTKCDNDAMKWLIVDQQGSTVCADRPCSLGELHYEGRCVNITDESICGALEILYVEFTGEVHCDCLPDYIYDKAIEQCMEEHRQGSCPSGKILEFQEGQIVCVKNNCSTDGMVYNPEDGKCYSKTFMGACNQSKGFTLTFDSVNLTSSCYSTKTRNIFGVPALSSCPGGSKRDSLNRCQTVFRAEGATNFRVPTAEVVTISGCPKPFIRLPNGICKRPNPLLTAQY